MNITKISIPFAFLIVVLVWSTTPLAIQWSSADGAPMTSALMRMAIGMLFSLAINMLMSKTIPRSPAVLKIYLVSGGSIFICMGLTYAASRLIPSGWIAVLFGLSPLFTGLFSSLVEPESKFTPSHLFGLGLGITGLYLVFSASLNLQEASLPGIILMLIATITSSATSVVIRQLVKPLDISGMQITTGSLIVAVPLFAIAAQLMEPPLLSVRFSDKALASTLYLSLVGTGIGFTLYYYLLKHVTANRIALITLITPVSGLLVGSWLNNEPLVGEIWIGAALVCTGLLIYEFKPKLGLRKL